MDYDHDLIVVGGGAGGAAMAIQKAAAQFFMEIEGRRARPASSSR